MKKNKIALLAGIALFITTQSPVHATINSNIPPGVGPIIRNVENCIKYYNNIFDKYRIGSTHLQSKFAAKEQDCTKKLVKANERYNKGISRFLMLQTQLTETEQQIIELNAMPQTAATKRKLKKLTSDKAILTKKIPEVEALFTQARGMLIELRDLLGKNTA